MSDPRVTGYRLRYWFNVATVPTVIDAGLETRLRLYPLKPGRYTGVVYAYGADGLASGGSNTVVDIVADTTPPRLTMTAPLTGTTVVRQSRIRIRGRATDDVKVTQIQVYVNGVKVCSRTTPAYTCTWTVPNRPGVYRLQAIAWDAAGHQSRSAGISVTAR